MRVWKLRTTCLKCWPGDRYQAEQALMFARGRHQQQTGARASWAGMEDSVNYQQLVPGIVYRNGSKV